MLQGKPSETAMRVAMAVVAARQDEMLRPLARHADEPYLEWFVREHSDGARRYLEAWSSAAGAPVIAILRKRMAEGAGLFTVLRKLYVEDEAEAALASGTRQLLVLGAGYDPLALRLCRRYPDLRAFEVDHPATQQVKRGVLEARAALPANLALVPVDFVVEAADAALAAAGFDPGRPSVVVCEGTLMYLAPAEADGVCALAARLCAPGARFVFTWVDARVLAAGADAAALARALESAGEPLRSSREPDTLAPFLAGHGFRLAALGDAAALRARYLEPHGITRPLSTLEYAVLAVRVDRPA
jgi:methyltransferase (TIGR00027 family)